MEETVDLPVAIDPVRPRRSILAVWVEADHAVEERCRSSKLLSVTYLRYGMYSTEPRFLSITYLHAVKPGLGTSRAAPG